MHFHGLWAHVLDANKNIFLSILTMFFKILLTDKYFAAVTCCADNVVCKLLVIVHFIYTESWNLELGMMNCKLEKHLLSLLANTCQWSTLQKQHMYRSDVLMTQKTDNIGDKRCDAQPPLSVDKEGSLAELWTQGCWGSSEFKMLTSERHFWWCSQLLKKSHFRGIIKSSRY